MQEFFLPYINLPGELVSLLKSNLSAHNLSEEIFSKILKNRALNLLIESTFPEFHDSKKLDKMIFALGWNGFRDRLASLYISRAETRSFPRFADAGKVTDISEFEERFAQYCVSGFSRSYLLGFYLKLASISLRASEGDQSLSIIIPDEIEVFLRLSQNRSEKIDILILVLCHLYYGLGDKLLLNSLASGKPIDALYDLLDPVYRKQMSDNLLAYSASINETDTFLYEKV
jgi:hypothetical protein